MMDYVVFGRRLRSAVQIPELTPAPVEGPPDLSLEVLSRPPETDGQTLLGREAVTPDADVRLWTSGSGALRLDFDDTGQFLLTPGRIAWWPGPAASPDDVRLDLIGRVLPLAVQAEGPVALHASAVAIGGQAVAFMAPKGCGKSTLSLACVRQGFRLLSDDVAMVDAGPPATMPAGVLRSRVTPETCRFFDAEDGAGPVRADGKHVLDHGDGLEDPFTPYPVGALYLLAPVPSRGPGGPMCRRIRLEAFRASAALLGQSKLGGLLGPGMRPALLRSLALLTASTPVYVLEVPRDLEALGNVSRQLGAWHAGPADRSRRGA